MGENEVNDAQETTNVVADTTNVVPEATPEPEVVVAPVVVNKFDIRKPYGMVQSKDDTTYQQEGVIYDHNYVQIGTYDWVAPRAVDENNVPLDQYPVDGDGNPVFTDSKPYQMIQSVKDPTVYKQNGSIFDNNKKYVGKDNA